MVFENYSKASKERQAKFPKEVRSERMRKAALARWANTTPEQRLKHAHLMIEGKIWKSLQKKL
jgi:hypothetical protein